MPSLAFNDEDFKKVIATKASRAMMAMIRNHRELRAKTVTDIVIHHLIRGSYNLDFIFGTEFSR